MKTAPPEITSFAAPPSFIALEPKTSGCAKSNLAASPNAASQNFVMPDDSGQSDGVLVVALMLTRKCNMTCAHCSVESSPRVKGEPTEEELLQVVRDAARTGAKVIQLTGGEPMLRENIVMRLLTECRALGMAATLTTNAFWGKSPEQAAQKVKALSDGGVGRMTISYDRFHAEFQGPQPAVNIVRAIEEMNLPLQLSINFTRAADDDLTDLVAPFQEFSKPQMRFYDVQKVGRARDMEGELRGETAGFCTGCCVPTVTDDGRVTACNGPSYFSHPDSPLSLGSLKEYSLSELVEKHRRDPILETIRTFGPERLRRELEQAPGFENFPFQKHYSGMCDLCLHLNSHPDAMQVVRAQLSSPRALTERIAAQRVMRSARSGEGELTRDFINSIGACRVFLRAAIAPPETWKDDAERVLGRPDFDWNHHALHLMRCGFSLPLQRALDAPALARWAPPFFIERLKKQGIHDALRVLLQREALNRIAAVLREVGARGVLLKGTAMMALDFEKFGDENNRRVSTRSSCDVDVFIAPEHAPEMREKLLQMGFKGAQQNGATSHLHQLETLEFGGFAVEIHQTLQPAFCGLPEREMLARARPLQSAAWQSLSTLDAEGMMLHSVVHLSKHLFAHGLKTAWDVVWLLDRFPDLDWKRLETWVQKTGMRRGFWVPLRVLCHELSIPISSEFLERAPRGKRQEKLETMARRHLFGTTKFSFEDNPWVCHALYGAMSDSHLHRARCAADLIFDRHAIALRREHNRNDPQHRAGRIRKLRVALEKWRQLG